MRSSRFKTIGLSAALAASAALGVSTATQAQSVGPTISYLSCESGNGQFFCDAGYTTPIASTVLWSGAGVGSGGGVAAGSGSSTYNGRCNAGFTYTVTFQVITPMGYLGAATKSYRFTCRSTPI